MTMKLSNEFKTIRDNFLAAVNNNEPAEKQNELYGAMLDELLNEAKKQARAEAEGLILLQTRQTQNYLLVNGNSLMQLQLMWATKKKKLLPQETIDRIF
ncbi:MAG: hypothetical protein ACLT90_12650 [Enterococcus raffinosus]